MSATGIKEVRIYHAALPEAHVKRRAAELVRLLALGLARSVVKAPVGAGIQEHPENKFQNPADLPASGMAL
ncbi:hypothetical protein K8I61_04990 [bacterium]|nr:hypothetical protein [bacterium]